MAYFLIPRNLPHAATITERIHYRLVADGVTEDERAGELMLRVAALRRRIGFYQGRDDPPDEEAEQAAEEAAQIGRRIVDEIERLGVGENRLGQCVRNLFECLGLGEEGAEISLRAGEDPNSLARPL